MVDVLAAGDVAYRIGSTVGTILWPTAGALLLFFGVRRRIALRRWVRQEEQRLLYPRPHGTASTSAPNPPADGVPLSRPGGGVVMIVVGAMLLAIGLLHIAARAVELGSSNSSSGIVVGQYVAGDGHGLGSLDAGPGAVSCGRPEAIPRQ